MKSVKMPALRPIPIKTKGLPFFDAYCTWRRSRRKWTLVEDWDYILVDEEGEKTIRIPKGFTFDGASIPRPFWSFLSPVGLLLIPALLHDYGYEHNELLQVKPNGQVEPYRAGAGKDFWDELFKREANRVNGMFVVNAIAWLAVSLFGGRF